MRASDIKPGFLASKLDLFDYSNMVNMLYSQKEKAVTSQGNSLSISYKIKKLPNASLVKWEGAFSSNLP